MQRPLRSIDVTAACGGDFIVVTMRNQTQDPMSERRVRRWLAIKHPGLVFISCDEADPELDADEEARCAEDDRQ